MAQLVKNPPAMQETWVQSLGWEDPLKKGKATHSSILAWRSPQGHKESDMSEPLSLCVYNLYDAFRFNTIEKYVYFPFELMYSIISSTVFFLQLCFSCLWHRLLFPRFNFA